MGGTNFRLPPRSLSCHSDQPFPHLYLPRSPVGYHPQVLRPCPTFIPLPPFYDPATLASDTPYRPYLLLVFLERPHRFFTPNQYLWYLTYVRSKIWLLTQNKHSYANHNNAILLVFDKGYLTVPNKLDRAVTLVTIALVLPMGLSSGESAGCFVSWFLVVKIMVTVKTPRFFGSARSLKSSENLIFLY